MRDAVQLGEKYVDGHAGAEQACEFPQAVPDRPRRRLQAFWRLQTQETLAAQADHRAAEGSAPAEGGPIGERPRANHQARPQSGVLTQGFPGLHDHGIPRVPEIRHCGGNDVAVPIDLSGQQFRIETGLDHSGRLRRIGVPKQIQERKGGELSRPGPLGRGQLARRIAQQRVKRSVSAGVGGRVTGRGAPRPDAEPHQDHGKQHAGGDGDYPEKQQCVSLQVQQGTRCPGQAEGDQKNKHGGDVVSHG
jgi:hypothetical protein